MHPDALGHCYTHLACAYVCLEQHCYMNSDTILPSMQVLTNLAWSMAHLDFKSDTVMDAILTVAVDDVADLNPRDITELLSALAIFDHNVSSKQVDVLAQHMIVLLSEPGKCASAGSVAVH